MLFGTIGLNLLTEFTWLSSAICGLSRGAAIVMLQVKQCKMKNSHKSEIFDFRKGRVINNSNYVIHTN